MKALAPTAAIAAAMTVTNAASTPCRAENVLAQITRSVLPSLRSGHPTQPLAFDHLELILT
jgi:hypothetical protein